jgi:hypothetical protein
VIDLPIIVVIGLPRHKGDAKGPSLNNPNLRFHSASISRQSSRGLSRVNESLLAKEVSVVAVPCGRSSRYAIGCLIGE